MSIYMVYYFFYLIFRTLKIIMKLIVKWSNISSFLLNPDTCFAVLL